MNINDDLPNEYDSENGSQNQTPNDILAAITASANKIQLLQKKLDDEKKQLATLKQRFEQTLTSMWETFGIAQEPLVHAVRRSLPPRSTESRFKVVLTRYYNQHQATLPPQKLRENLLAVAKKTASNIKKDIPESIIQWIENVTTPQTVAAKRKQ